jgi:hypothetical protein
VTTGHHFSRNADIRDLCQALIAEGWRFERGAKHSKLYTPDGREMITVPGTPGDRRSVINFMLQIKRLRARLNERRGKP